MIEVEAEGTLDARKEEIASFVEAFRDADLRTLQERAEAEDAAYAESIADEGSAATDMDS